MPAEFPVYSISKPFLAQAVLELTTDLDAEIGALLPSLSPTFANRTLSQLLNHTSGLADYSELESYNDAVKRNFPAWSRDKLLSQCADLDNSRHGFHYSNVGYLLLRMFVENQTKLSYFEALKQLVFAPLGIDGLSAWEHPSSPVLGYDPAWVYSGTFLATEDSIKVAFQKLLQHREATIGIATLATHVPFANTGFENPSYGLGLMMDLAPNQAKVSFVGHGGGGPGYAHMILANPKTWRIAIESSQRDFNQADAILRLRQETSN